VSSDSTSQKEAAPLSGKAANRRRTTIRESRISSETQAQQIDGRLYQLKPICTTFGQIDWKNLRRWQRRKDHERWIRDFIVEAHDRTLFVTVTFYRFASARQAKAAARRFLRKRLAAVIEAYVRVIERQGNGRAHIHWLLRLISSASVCGWKAIELAIARHGKGLGFGRYQVEFVGHPLKLARYLTKTLTDSEERVDGKVITYSTNIRRVRYVADPGAWERAVRRFAESVGCTTKAELTSLLGVGWPFRYRHQIYAMR
jgi:hypothetical protein